MTLRIQRSVEHHLVIFILTGRIQAEQIPELIALLKSESPRQEIGIDLKNVKLIDRDAVRFLAQLEAAGARLRNCSGFIREWITQEKNQAE
jgi:anti-anti-sigma regulatory factor